MRTRDGVTLYANVYCPDTRGRFPKGISDEPPIQLFVIDDNRWRDEHEWPLARTKYTNVYLHSGRKANSLRGNGTLSFVTPKEEQPDRYVYDPSDPVPTPGGTHSVLR